MPSLSSTDNVKIKIILTKVASVKVSVFTIQDDGVTINDGMLQNSDAYVNVAVKSNSVNRKAIITAANEGAYYTGDFDVTYNPHSRTVSVLEGSTLDVFAQLPNSGDYVISKITCDGNGFNNISVSGAAMSNGNLRETLNTGNTVIYSDKVYDLKIYIQRARTIYTRVIKDHDNGIEEYGGGTVVMRGTHATEGAIPFTKLVPSYETNPYQYNALNGFGNNWTTEAKAIRDTNISFTVKPPSNYGIKTVTVKSGTTKANAQPVSFTTSAPSSNGTVTYTVSEPMSPNSDLFVDISYAVLDGGTVAVDFEYTDDYEHYYNLFDPENGISTLNTELKGAGYGATIQLVRDLQTNEEKYSFTNITYSTDDYPTYKFYVSAGSSFRVYAGAILNGKSYTGIEDQCGVYDADTGELISSGGGTSIQYGINAGVNLLFKVRLAPISSICASAVNYNCYNGTPADAEKFEHGSISISASAPPVTQPIAIPHALYDSYYGWVNSKSYGNPDMIMMGSTVNSVSINYTGNVDPGKITSVMLYEFDKSVTASSYSRLKAPIENEEYTNSWQLNYSSSSESGGNEYRTYTPQTPIQVKSDKSYRAIIMYDKITVNNETERDYGYVKPYLYYGSDNPDDINMSALTSDKYESLQKDGRARGYAENTIDTKTVAYYVLVSDLPKEDLSLTKATFTDYVEGKDTVSILSELLRSYTHRTHNGVTKYYYYYRLNPNDTHPIDNSISLYSYFDLRTDSPPSVNEQNNDCDISVEQWNRDTYDGNYVAASNQKVRFSV